MRSWPLLLLLATTAGPAQKPDILADMDRQIADANAICGRIGPPKPPLADRPTTAQKRALRNCSSEELYYGIHGQPQYDEARLCAFSEADRDDANASVFSGDTILMQLYANGLGGVKRNPNLAIAYACAISGAAAEVGGRVAHLKAAPKRGEQFDYCDDITSGMGQNQCADLDMRQAKVERDRKLAALVARLPKPAHPLYATLKARFDAFAEARGGEMNNGGTGWYAISVAPEIEKVSEQFVADFTNFIVKRRPVDIKSSASALDAQLNAKYRETLAALGKVDPSYRPINADDVQATERKWIAYRDAYVAFAKAVPGIDQPSLLKYLIRQRIDQLEDTRLLALEMV